MPETHGGGTDAVRGTLHIRVLGGLRVDGVGARALGSRKGLTVLKYLALRNGLPTSVDALIDATWPDGAPSDPPAQIAVLVSRLRATLGRDAIHHHDGTYQLVAATVDLDQLAAAATAATATTAEDPAALDAIAATLAACQGGLLPGDDADWVVDARRRADEMIAALRHRGAALALRSGRAELAAAWSADALAADPFDEEALRQLMLAEQRRGRPAVGLKAYAALRRTLIDELGVSPSAETEAVHLALLGSDAPSRSDPAPVPPPAARAVAARSPIVGRRAELRSLLDEVARAASGHGRLVVIEGEPGIGKSALLHALHDSVNADTVVLHAACEPVFGALPLQPLADALRDHLAGRTENEAAVLLAGHHATIQRLLGSVPTDADSWLDASLVNRQIAVALEDVVRRVGEHGPVLVTIDDAHLADAATLDLLAWLRRRVGRACIVVTRRPGLRDIPNRDRVLLLAPLDRRETEELVGAERAERFHERTGGNPLFLTQLAASDSAELPESLLDAVSAIVDGLGSDGELVRAAANLGDVVDVELLATVSGVAPLAVLGALDVATARRLLVLDGRHYRFRHALVREAIAGRTPLPRAALLHREAARVLEQRPGHDPLQIAHHARLAGDLAHTADALVRAAEASTGRFDRAAAEAFLDQAIAMDPDASRFEARARVRTMRGHYDAALDDVDRALSLGAGAAALEAGAWAAYFARRTSAAREFADDGAATAPDDTIRASCLTVGARVRHAAGRLGEAEPMFGEAIRLARGTARLAPSVWLGVLRSQQSRPAEALELMRPATRVELGGERTTELLHALLYTGHSQALSGRPLEALDTYRRYDAELARRQVPRYLGRGANFAGWVRRALGQWDRADDENRRALAELGAEDFPETVVAAHADLASSHLLAHRRDDAAKELAAARAAFRVNLTFGWRLQLRLQLLEARLRLLDAAAEDAHALATEVGDAATSIGVPRYADEAALLALRADAVRARRGVDLHAAAPIVARLADTVGIDAWWVLAEAATAPGADAWQRDVDRLVAAVQHAAGPEGAALPQALGRLRSSRAG